MADDLDPAVADTRPCCCNYGAAVRGEWPEFECARCPRHVGGFAQPDEMCKRHKREESRG